MYLTGRIWWTYAVLFAIAIPWYWQFLPKTALTVVLGFPLWVLVAVCGSAVISAYTAWLLLRREWTEKDPSARAEKPLRQE